MPEPCNDAILAAGKLITIGAEREAETFRRAFLCRRRMEEGIEQRAAEFLVPWRRVQRLERVAQQRLQPRGVTGVPPAGVGDEPRSNQLDWRPAPPVSCSRAAPASRSP